MENINQTQREPAIKKAWLRVILMFISFLIAIIIFQGIATVIYGLVTNTNLNELQEVFSDPNNWGITYIMQFVSLSVTIAIVWIFRKFIDRKSIVSIGLNIKGKKNDIVWGFLTGLILMVIGYFVLKFSNNLEVEAIKYDSLAIFGSLFFFTMVGISEELLFRGYILNNLMESSKNKYIALLISALLFALMHGLNPNISILAITNLILAGLALGITYIHTKNLWFPIFLHISWNYFQGPIFGFEVSGTITKSVIKQKVTGSELITGGDFGFEGSILLTFLLIGMIIFTDLILKRKMKPSNI